MGWRDCYQGIRFVCDWELVVSFCRRWDSGETTALSRRYVLERWIRVVETGCAFDVIGSRRVAQRVVDGICMF